MDNNILVNYLNTFCNFLIKLVPRERIIISDPKTRSIFYLLKKRSLIDDEEPYIYMYELCYLCIDYHNKLLMENNYPRFNKLKLICHEIHVIILDCFKNSKINIEDNINTILLFEKSNKLIKKYLNYFSYEIQVEDISNYL